MTDQRLTANNVLGEAPRRGSIRRAVSTEQVGPVIDKRDKMGSADEPSALAAEVARLRVEVKQLRDIEEIRDLVFSCAHFADERGHHNEFAANFATDAELVEFGTVLTHRWRIAALIERGWARFAAGDASRWPGWTHGAINVRVQVNGDTATAQSYFSSGRYLDDLVRLDGRWVIKRRTAVMCVELGADHPVVTLYREVAELREPKPTPAKSEAMLHASSFEDGSVL